MTAQKFYSLDKIEKKKATYNVIFGERSNGKTYAALQKAVKNWAVDHSQLAYVRRWKEDLIGKRASRLFAGLVENGEIERITNGDFKGVHYWAGKFYLCTYDDNGKPIYNDGDLLGFTFSLSDGEHDKSTSYPNVKTVIFDEFLTNKLYLQDEFVHFMNVVSTIVRRRTGVKIYMLGNTVNKFCPYFKEMGLDNIAKMLQGTIDVYRYGASPLTVAVEYCTSSENNTEETNQYFAFNNPKLQMITGGAWELNIYPHLPYKYKPKDIQFTYFIEFNDAIFQCEIIALGATIFTFIHVKTTPIRDAEKTIIYTLEHKAEPNYNRALHKPTSKIQQRILWFFKNDKVFYQNNEVGDAIHNFLKVSK